MQNSNSNNDSTIQVDISQEVVVTQCTATWDQLLDMIEEVSQVTDERAEALMDEEDRMKSDARFRLGARRF